VAVGYVRGRDVAEVDRHAAAIRRACVDRGWTLAQLVREGSNGPRRPGLVHALRHSAEGDASRIVVDDVRHLGGTPKQLATVLSWSARNHLDVVALDVGLDTGTREGRLAAECVLAVGGDDGPAAPAPRPAPAAAARGGRAAAGP
jgi:hypothetical protein